MTDTNPPAAQEPNAEEAERIAARVRRLMLISAATTGIAVAAVLFAIVYKVVRGEGSASPAIAEQTAMLPKGARIVSTTVAGDRLVVTLDIAGATEIRTFDARTLKPTGRLGFANSP